MLIGEGLHVYMGGVGIQQAFILLFLFFAIKFHRTLLHQAREDPSKNIKHALPLLYTLYAVLILITVYLLPLATPKFAYANNERRE
jgi:uncharacterized membrane protein YedE/YeeE